MCMFVALTESLETQGVFDDIVSLSIYSADIASLSIYREHEFDPKFSNMWKERYSSVQKPAAQNVAKQTTSKTSVYSLHSTICSGRVKANRSFTCQ